MENHSGILGFETGGFLFIYFWKKIANRISNCLTYFYLVELVTDSCFQRENVLYYLCFLSLLCAYLGKTENKSSIFSFVRSSCYFLFSE